MMLWDGLVVRDAGRAAGGRYGNGGQGREQGGQGDGGQGQGGQGQGGQGGAEPTEGGGGDTVATGNQSPELDGPGPARVRR